jgi:hypothetical protein
VKGNGNHHQPGEKSEDEWHPLKEAPKQHYQPHPLKTASEQQHDGADQSLGGKPEMKQVGQVVLPPLEERE